MLNKLRGFTNTKLAGVLIAIIIIPFVLMLQPLTSLYGYSYIKKFKNLNKNETRFFVF